MAQAWAAEWRESWIDQHKAEHRASSGPVTFGQVLDAYGTAVCATTRWDTERFRAEALRHELGDDTPVADLTVAGMTAWRDRMHREGRERIGKTGRKRKPLGKRSVNAYLVLLQAIMNHAVKEGLLAENHLRHIRKFQEEYGAPDALTPAQRDAVFEALDEWEAEIAAKRLARIPEESIPQVPLRGIVMIAYWTMARTATVVGLTWEQVRWAESEIHLPRTKNRRYVVLPMDPELHDYLLSIYPGPGTRGLVHANPGGRPWLNFHVQWRRLLVLANGRLRAEDHIPVDFRAYNLRHTRATDLADAGVPAKVIADWMGDTSVATIERHYFGRNRRVSAHHWLEVARKFREATTSVSLDTNHPSKGGKQRTRAQHAR